MHVLISLLSPVSCQLQQFAVPMIWHFVSLFDQLMFYFSGVVWCLPCHINIYIYIYIYIYMYVIKISPAQITLRLRWCSSYPNNPYHCSIACVPPVLATSPHRSLCQSFPCTPAHQAENQRFPMPQQRLVCSASWAPVSTA